MSEKSKKFKEGLKKAAKAIKPKNAVPGIAGLTMAMADERAKKAKGTER